MTVVVVVLVVFFLVGLALGLYTWLAPRAAAERDEPRPPVEPWRATSGWTVQTGDEFSGLSESARCDLIFAVADLHDERSKRMLLHALDDPSDAVVLAAAHALAKRGATEAVNEYAQRNPGERAERIVSTLALME